MDNLQTIWNQLQITTNQLEKLIKKENNTSIFDKLKKEEELRRKFNPFLVVFIALFTVFFTVMIKNTEGSLDTQKIIGIAFVTLASIVIAYFAQCVKMPLDEFEHDKSSVKFLSIVKEKLDKSKNTLVFGILLQIAFLTIGLTLIIFSDFSFEKDFGKAGLLWGVMFGVGGGIATASIITFFNRHYKEVYEKIEIFCK